MNMYTDLVSVKVVKVKQLDTKTSCQCALLEKQVAPDIVLHCACAELGTFSSCSCPQEEKRVIPKSVLSFPNTLHPQGWACDLGILPNWSDRGPWPSCARHACFWMAAPRHALTPQRRVIIGRKQLGTRWRLGTGLLHGGRSRSWKWRSIREVAWNYCLIQ